jgi:hypothetical protein
MPRTGIRRTANGRRGIRFGPSTFRKVPNRVDRLLRIRVDLNDEAEEFLMPMALHVAADNGPVEDIERGEQRRRVLRHATLVWTCRDRRYQGQTSRSASRKAIDTSPSAMFLINPCRALWMKCDRFGRLFRMLRMCAASMIFSRRMICAT